MSDAPSPPPGYVGYGDPGAVNRKLRRIRSLSTGLIVLVAIEAPLSLANAVDAFRNADRARQLLRGEITVDAFRDSFGSNPVARLAQALVLPIAVLTVVWMFRMAQNLRILGRQGLRFAPGWAIGGWFVPPCILYVIPWLMFRELWRASEPGAGGDRWRQARVSPIVDVWWVLYGLLPIAQLFSSAGLAGVLRAGTTDEATRAAARQLDSYLGLNVALAVVGTLAAVAFLLLVMGLSSRHRQAIGEI